MAVKFTKPEINVREKLAELDKPSGIAGEAMLRAETPQEQFNLIGAGRRNLIINGGMTVAQRGTSFGSTLNNIYTLDRWKVARYAANNYYTTQEAGTGGDPFLNYIKVRRNTGDTATGALSLTQRIEPINFKQYRGRTVTLSFLYRTGTTFSPQYLRAGILGSTSSSATLTYWAYAAAGVGARDQQIEPSTTWKQHTISFHLGTNVEQLAVAFGTETPYSWTGTAGSDDSFQIANVQLEAGEIATPFEHRSYGEELALCQRYFCTGFPVGATIADGQSVVGTNDGINGWVAFGNNVARSPYIHYPVEMRASPSVTLYSVGGMANGKWGIYDGSAWQAVGSAAINTTNKHFNVRENNSAFTMGIGKAYLLKGQWTASAEL